MATPTTDLNEIRLDIPNEGANTGNGSSSGVQILHKYNYDSWMFNMENDLKFKDLWCVVKKKQSQRLRRKYLSIWETKNSEAHDAMKRGCGQRPQEWMTNSESAYAAWCRLKMKGRQAVEGRLRVIEENLEKLRQNTTRSNAGASERTLLTSSNYESWKREMEDQEAHLNYETIRDRCVPDMLPHIMYTDDPKEAWNLLEQAFNIPSEPDDQIKKEEEKERYREILAAARTSRFTCMDDVITVCHGLGYEGFKDNVKEYLKIQHLWDVVGGTGYEEPTIYNLDTWRNKNTVALEIIRRCCPMEKKHLIYRSKFAEEAWCRLERPANPDQDTFELDPHIRFRPIADNFRKDKPFRGFARTFLNAFPEIMSDRLSHNGLTLLHSVFMFGIFKCGKDLIELMDPEQIRKETDEGYAAISLAVEANNVQMVKLMVSKNSKLLLMRNEHNHIPLITSAINGDEEMLRYLLSMTPGEDIFSNEVSDIDGATLVTAVLRVEIYDIALNLLEKFPRLAMTPDNDGMTVYNVLAGKPSAFPSGNRFGLFERCLYPIAGVGSYGFFGEALKMIVPCLRELHDKKVQHYIVADIVDIICTELSNVTYKQLYKQLRQSKVFDAVSLTIIHGNVELFSAIHKTNGDLIRQRDVKGNGLFQLAVLYRQQNVFMALMDLGIQHTTTAPLDKEKNNILHCAAFWRPLLHLHEVSGAALQMQRELQWFKEVQKVVKPKYREMENKDGLKPEALFTQEHKDLVREGEKWVKEASQACMVVSTLIATVMFAAAFTVPGGNNQDTGLPMFLKSKVFLFFIISDAVSLFASCTSVLMFFTLLTSRYAERDFLKSLPRKLIFGLLFLFISIATMLATFAATLVIVLREQYSWVYIPVGVSASIPVLLFGSLQFPLFVEIVKSTYGRGIFRRKKSGFLYNTRMRVSRCCVNNKLYTCFFGTKTN